MRTIVFAAAAGAALALAACQEREPVPEAAEAAPSAAGPGVKPAVAEPDGVEAMGARIVAPGAEAANPPVTPLKDLGAPPSSG
jgi:hypothetical protein